MFLWKPATGALYLWSEPDLSTGELTFQQTELRASGWNTGASLALRGADLNSDTVPDLWTVTDNATVTAYLVSGLTGTPEITGQPPQMLNPAGS